MHHKSSATLLILLLQALDIVEQTVATQAMDPSASTPHMHQVG